jgi:hypothetical protein
MQPLANRPINLAEHETEVVCKQSSAVREDRSDVTCWHFWTAPFVFDRVEDFGDLRQRSFARQSGLIGITRRASRDAAVATTYDGCKMKTRTRGQ